VAFATTVCHPMRLNLPVDEIIVDEGWRARFESWGGDRKRVVAWSVFVAVLIGAFAVYPRLTSPDPVIAAPASEPEAGAPRSRERLFVHVAGAVVDPGLYTFASGARVADAIEAAGGPGRRADLDAVNLAEVLRDGLKIDVPVRGTTVPVSSTSTPGTSIVNLNTADQPTLETIPGVGPVTATAILQHRTELGSFDAVEQLLDVTGIGPATLEALRPYVTV
jgi:competence protein ComEA